MNVKKTCHIRIKYNFSFKYNNYEYIAWIQMVRIILACSIKKLPFDSPPWSCFVSKWCIHLICPRLWPVEDICISLYVLKSLLNVRYSLEKGYVDATLFRRVFRKIKKSWIEVCWKFCSLDGVGWRCKSVFKSELCRTQYRLKYFSKLHRPSDRLENP